MDTGTYGTSAICQFFQKSMSFYVFHEPQYQIYEVYIDDLLVYGHDDDDFVTSVRTIFQKCRDKIFTLNIYLGLDTVPFVGHDLDATGINMSQKRIKSPYNSQNQIPLRNYAHSWAWSIILGIIFRNILLSQTHFMTWLVLQINRKVRR